MFFVLFCFFNFYLFIYLWLCWVFVSVRGLSLVAASGGHSSSQCAGLSLSRPLLLQSTGSRRAGSAIVTHGPSCSAACGIFPDQGSNPCPLHWQADSQPLCHQGSSGQRLLSKEGAEMPRTPSRNPLPTPSASPGGGHRAASIQWVGGGGSPGKREDRGAAPSSCQQYNIPTQLQRKLVPHLRQRSHEMPKEARCNS